MKAILVIGLIVVAAWFGWKLSNDQMASNKKNESTAAAAPEISGRDLPGLPPNLEGTLETAERRGATGLHDFLTRYGKLIRDPRLAWIELDYTVLVARENPAEARRVFAKVKGRITSGSPVYSRVKQLENTFQ